MLSRCTVPGGTALYAGGVFDSGSSAPRAHATRTAGDGEDAHLRVAQCALRFLRSCRRAEKNVNEDRTLRAIADLQVESSPVRSSTLTFEQTGVCTAFIVAERKQARPGGPARGLSQHSKKTFTSPLAPYSVTVQLVYNYIKAVYFSRTVLAWY